MAYGLKYELLCTTIKGNLYKVKVLFDAYTGSQINRDVPLSPFKLKKDKAAIIRGTSLDFSIREVVDFEFLEFCTSGTKKVKVELYDPSDNLIWAGYNLPQQYQTPYVPCPNIITFTATDGLGLLKEEKYTYYPGFLSLFTILQYCLNTIGLELGYSIAVNLFATLHDHSRTSLAQTYIEADTYAGLSCYEVIENILKIFNAEITQGGGRWRITRSVDKKSTRMLYNSSGIYETIGAAPAVFMLGLPGAGIDVSPRGSLQMGIEPGGKRVKIKKTFLIKRSILLNSDFAIFSIYDDPEFKNWTRTGNFNPVQEHDNSGMPYALIPFTGLAAQLNQPIDVEARAGQDFSFSINVGTIYKNADGTPNAYDIACKIMVSLTVGSVVYYLVNNPIKFDGKTQMGWLPLATPYYIKLVLTASSSDKPEFKEITVITSSLPGSGVLDVNLYGPSEHHPYVVNESYFAAYGDVRVNFGTPGQSQEVLAEFTDSVESNELPEIELLITEGSDFANTALIATNCLCYADGTPIT